MKKLLKKIPFPVLPVLFGTIIAILGLILMIAPDTSLNTVCFIGGIAVLLKALGKLFDYIKGLKNNATRTTDLVSFVVSVCIGIVLMVHPDPLLSVFPVIIGIITLICGVIAFFSKGRSTLWGKIVAAIIVVLAIVVINSPMILAEAATSISGIALFVIGVFMIAVKFFAQKKLKEWDIEINPDDFKPDYGYKEVEFRDVDE